MSFQVFSGSSSARSLAARRGLGRIRHMESRFLWLQERLAAKHFTLHKVHTDRNIADTLTKVLPPKTVEKYLTELGLVDVVEAS